MPESLNPINIAHSLSSIPQIHFIGSRDTVIPQEIAYHFVQAQTDPLCTLVRVVPHRTHYKGWQEEWPTLLEESLKIEKGKALEG